MKRALGIPVALALLATPALAAVGGGEITMKNKGGAVTFSHATHVEGLELGCQSCHPKLFTNVAQHKAATMKAMQGGASCGACHNGTKAFSVKGNCARCHTK